MKVILQIALGLLAALMVVSCVDPAQMQLSETSARAAVGGYNVYYGDLHNHSTVSDGSGSPAQAYAYARDTAGLDFFGLADHSGGISSSEWTTIKSAAQNATRTGSFVGFWGFEWTSSSLGHVAVIGSDDYCTTSGSTSSFRGLVNWLNSRNCVAFFNHPGRQNSTGQEFDNFSGTPSDKFVGIELYNKTSAYSRYFYNDGYYRNDNQAGYFQEANQRGWKLGAAGGDDNHQATWSTRSDYRLAVLAPSLTRSSIFSAFQTRRFYSTLDKNLGLSFKIAGKEMGSDVTGSNLTLKIELQDGDNEIFTSVKLLNDEMTTVKTWSPNTTNVTINDTVAGRANGFYYIVVRQADGDEAVSSPIWATGGGTLNIAPTCEITAPADGATFPSNSTVTISATAADTDGSVAQVEFFNGALSVGVDTTSPYSISLNNLSVGSHTFTAVATDNLGADGSSTPITIQIGDGGTCLVPVWNVSTVYNTGDQVHYNGRHWRAGWWTQGEEPGTTGEWGVWTDLGPCPGGSTNKPPTVVITAPANGSSVTAGSNVTVTASANDTDGTVASVSFYNGSQLLGTDSVSPYSYEWINPAEGSYQITAVAIDNEGASTTSAAITFSVTGQGNISPVVVITSPAEGASFAEGATITIAADASDQDGSIASVEFFNGSLSLGTDSTAPFSVDIANAAAGSYTITVVATDNLGATGSDSVSFSVTAGGVQPWQENLPYSYGDLVTHNGSTWKCVYAHTSNAAWYPGATGIWFWEKQ